MWLVVYECIYRVIEVSPDGVGFFACGQEPLWSFDNIQDWIMEIKPSPTLIVLFIILYIPETLIVINISEA